MSILRPGQTLGNWRVTRALGSGGMGSVYVCEHVELTAMRAALKVLEIGSMPQAVERFAQEAELLVSLDHGSIVKVLDASLRSDPPFLVMELVEGEPLDRRLAAGPVTAREACGWMSTVADALAYLHARGVGHRDVKPANLVLGKDGAVKLVDFGIATDQGAERLTRTGQLSPATVIYAPPEWIDDADGPVQEWDAYSLGVTLVELLWGRVPFDMPDERDPFKQAVRLALSKQQHPPLDPGPGASDALRALVARLTATRPEDRLSDMSEAHRVLCALAAEEAAQAEQPPRAAPVRGPGPETLVMTSPPVWLREVLAAGAASTARPAPVATMDGYLSPAASKQDRPVAAPRVVPARAGSRGQLGGAGSEAWWVGGLAVAVAAAAVLWSLVQ